ncbi:MAG: TlpA family protein disulfide reductase [Chitinophagaceae bacterium]|nr:TlpA family protein disulfide reductase [Chitinophagaceae bacterium]
MKRIFTAFVMSLIAQKVLSQNIPAVKITDVEKMMKESRGPMIINMWATWCGPCVEEMPYFIQETRNYNKKAGADSIQLVFVSLDFKESYPAGISRFLSKQKIREKVVWLDETDADYFCPRFHPDWSGAIPATLFVNPKTGYLKFMEGQISHTRLKKLIKEMMTVQSGG